MTTGEGSNTPLVSIVIPTFNHAIFLKDAIDSLRGQTYSHWQAIIVNNYSTDDTIDIITGFNDDRIRLINFHNEGIIAASRNRGIHHATGEFVAFLDSDDMWYPGKLAACVAALQDGNDLVCHGELWVGESLRPREILYGPRSRATYNQLLYRGNCISTSATVVRRSILVALYGFSERTDFVTAEDYDLWLRIAKLTQRIEFIPQVLGEFRRHGGNASNAVLRNMSAELSVISDHFSRQDPSILNRLRQRMRRGRALYGAGRGLDVSGDNIQALRLFVRSFATSPFNMRLYPAILLALIHLFTPRSLR
ncbi:MAG: glycosyltransferase family 2 protein [Ilumatobacteraceae bacterium]